MRRGVILTIHGDVDRASGEIHHDGPVHVLGSVRPGLTLAAAGDILISKHVTNARVVSSGNLVVNGIVSGETTVLDAVGSVTVRQALDAKIVAGLDIEVRASAERCDLAAGRRIFVQGNPGLIRAGSARAGVGLEACRLESGGGIPAAVRVGTNPFQEESSRLRSRLDFARSQEARAALRRAETPEEYLRRVADLCSYRGLGRELDRRLRQFVMSDHPAGSPYVRVADPGAVGARIDLGECRDILPGRPEEAAGAFVAVFDRDEVRFRTVEEAARVG